MHRIYRLYRSYKCTGSTNVHFVQMYRFILFMQNVQTVQNVVFAEVIDFYYFFLISIIFSNCSRARCCTPRGTPRRVSSERTKLLKWLNSGIHSRAASEYILIKIHFFSASIVYFVLKFPDQLSSSITNKSRKFRKLWVIKSGVLLLIRIRWEFVMRKTTVVQSKSTCAWK